MEILLFVVWEVRVVGGVVDGEEDGVEFEGVGFIVFDVVEMMG